ncbi:peptidoglycan DD-metalloendopeptidase family protein [Streptomyces sp. NPDC094448]|uniref:peptidoglycan DD-metalloendopeptidase family protein n=1 Tax=Streptomyces sp. NPDC094448 TaxID=3366063 RepID=UPI003806A745
MPYTSPYTSLTALALLPALLSPSVIAGPATTRRPPPDPPRTTHHSVTVSNERVWPVPRPRILRGWTPPASPYGPGHRGVDLAAPPGTEVRATGSGRISFSGRIAGRGVLALTLDGTGDPPLRITHEPVDTLHPAGTRVTAGRTVARVSAAPRHCPTSCLHWGLLRARDYLDPLSLLHRPPSRLLPRTPRHHPRTGHPGHRTHP